MARQSWAMIHRYGLAKTHSILVRVFPCPRSKIYPFSFIAYLKELVELIKVSILLSARNEYFRSYEARKSVFWAKIDLLVVRFWEFRLGEIGKLIVGQVLAAFKCDHLVQNLIFFQMRIFILKYIELQVGCRLNYRLVSDKKSEKKFFFNFSFLLTELVILI